MSEGTPAEATRDLGRDAVLVELVVADPPEAWTAAGFTVEADTVRVGATTIRLTGRTNPYTKGITEWALAGVHQPGDDEQIEGLPTRFVDRPDADLDPPSTTAAHPNGVTGLDHVVVSTPDLERTIEALAAVGLECRRIRETTSYGSPMRQAFFHLGATVLEVVSGDTGSGRPAVEAPAAWFGLAVDVDDLDQTAALLGEGLGSIKVAVQDGRRIATLRHKALGMSVAVAAMDAHGDR